MSYHDAPRPRPYPVLESNGVSLEVRQQPQQALVTSEHKEKIRKAVDPPPIVQLIVHDSHSADQGTWLVNPFLFMTVLLVDAEPVNGVYRHVAGSNLLGSTVSSLHRLKDVNNKDGGFFVFGDISCRRTGVYRLQFNLFDFEKNNHQAIYVNSAVSDPFQVVTSKDFRGQMESTHLSRAFSDQGVRLRLRKEQRTITGSKRGLESSPNPSSTPSRSFTTQGALHHDRAYGFNPPKRQRSDSYTPQMYHTPQIPGNSLFQYGMDLQPGTHGMSFQPQQNIPASQGGSYGGLLSHTHTQSATTPNWQRHAQHEHLSGPVGGSGNNTYFSPLNTTRSAQRDQMFSSYAPQQSQQYLTRASDDLTSNLGGFQTPSSLPDTGLASHQSQPYLHHRAPDVSGQATNIGLGSPSYAMHYQQGSLGMQSHLGLRTGLTSASVPGYETRMQSGAGGASQDQQLQMRSAEQYDQGHYAGTQDLFPPSSRDSFSSRTANLSDADLSLDSGVLNRGFMPPYTGQHQDSSGQDIPELKDPAYPPPH